MAVAVPEEETCDSRLECVIVRVYSSMSLTVSADVSLTSRSRLRLAPPG
jgi:hypothetical protein